MSNKNNRSFIEEIQDKYDIGRMKYTPPYYAEAGMIIPLTVKAERPRTACPICGGYPTVHGYIKNVKIRNN